LPDMTTITKDSKSEIIEAIQQQPFEVAVESRNQALAFLDKNGLPTPKHEEYRFTPITRMLEKNFNWNSLQTPSTISSVDDFLIKGFVANVVVLVNGVYSKLLSKIISLESELTVCSLQEAFRHHQPAVEAYFNKVSNSENDAFAAMNTALWQDGVFIHVPENTNVDKPVLILHLNDATNSQVISHTRMVGILEKGSQLSVVEKSASIGTQPIFHNFSEEWVIKESAHLEYCKIQNESGKNYQVTNTVIQQHNKSVLNTFTLTLDGQLIRNNLNILIDGEQCESHFYGLYLLTGNTLADNHTVVDHKKPNSYSNELYKGIMDEKSKGVFNGKIFVRPHAQKTNAFQSNRNILVSDTASVNTKPQLEIWADDVKCSHGCTSGQLDDEAMFYLRSRGIAEPTAKAMLLYAFASEVLAPIQNETLKGYLDQLIAERLHKDF
jgi:Fe-S cluster assembly protein SufD